METEREMTERWVREAEYAIKSKFRKFLYIFALVVLIFLFIWFFSLSE
ncbi:MAG: hypothetical protein AABW58_03330 [Nanoarchaeota archaeon]